MTVKYMISVDRHSPLAQRLYGNGTVHINVGVFSIPFPRDEESLRNFLLNLAERKGIALPALFRLSRTHAKGEKRGWHGIANILVADPHSPLIIKKTFAGVKGIPGTPAYDDMFWKRSQGFGRFHSESLVEYA